ncbi:NfeD family protein [Aureibacillus halotolerans]|uniref:Membrane protein implicated in regulation of membrane protease activity n=1 Tax=Aureibacillus halotolerans TaxID=1508390 RepID=A0A4R6TXZ7_9BACI|nr:NfeD family protein [Aureibacillus halotolerans]TDQ36765.1 membrane protein implicated in regulation of membrane protease activity [Aureibacillus halotolerans]
MSFTYKGGRPIDLITVYWWVLGCSLAFSVLYFLLGDLMEGVLDGFLHPLLMFGTLAVIAACGLLVSIILPDTTPIWGLVISIIIGIVAYVLIFNFFIIPLQHAESSSTHSIYELEGRIGKVITSIPAEGYGEVFFTSVSGSRNEAAVSFDNTPIPQGTKVVVIKIDEGVHVSPFYEEGEF